MLTFINRRNLGARAARSAALCLLALGAALCQSREARAQWTTSGTNTTTTNNVGVGTTAPQAGVHVSTASGATGARGVMSEQTSNDDGGALFVVRKHRGGTPVLTGDFLGNFYAQGFDGTNFVSGSRMRFVVDGPVAANSVPTGMQFLTGNNNTGVERLRITSSGLIGIGTGAPTRALSVEAAVAPAIGLNTAGVERGTLGVSTLAGNWFAGTAVGDTSLRAQANDLWIGTYSAAKPIRFVTNDTQRLIIDGAGNVGINSTAPTAKLQIKSGTAAGTNMLHLDTGVYGGTFFSVGGTINNESTFNVAVYRGGQYFSRIGVTNYGHVYLAPDTAAYGNVGIGTTTPTSKLHVVGDITVTGNINAKYQDLAEWVPSVEKLAAGTVVILDVARDNHVASSSTSYDTRVAGVVSAQPGISLGERGEGKVLVATTGRVKVRVDATGGPINVGDLLVTSDRQGYAMKSEPVLVGKRQMHAPGTIIGKALESLAGGTGEILVLLSMQ